MYIYTYIYIYIYYLGGAVDGYVKIGDKVSIFEYLGCFWHGCDCGNGNPDLEKRVKQRMDWEEKKSILHSKGDLYSVWECQWEQYKIDHPETEFTDTHFPHIMKKEQTRIGLMNAIKEGSFFGFVNCDLW